MVLLTSAIPLLSFPAWAEAPADADVQSRSVLASAWMAAQSAGDTRSRNGATAGHLSVEGAIWRAVDWHPSVAEAASRMRQQDEQIKVARAGYLPQISAGFGTGYDTTFVDNQQDPALNVSASQVLYDFGKVSSSVDAATAGAHRDRARVLMAVDLVARDTAHAAIEVQRHLDLLEAAREQITGVTAIAALARVRSDKGASSRSDVLQAQSRIEAARATEQQILAQYSRWQSVLRNLLGSRVGVDLSREFPPELSNACQGLEPDFALVPEMVMAEATRAEALAHIERARANGLPTLSLDGNLNRYREERAVRANVVDDQDYSVALNFSMPLYRGGATTAHKQAAAYALQAADAARDTARLQVTQGLLEAQEQTGSLSQRLGILSLRERSIAETRDLYRQQYLSLGTRSLLDLLNAEQELHQARFDYSNTRHDLHRLQISCLYSAGGLRRAFHLENRQIQGVEI